MGCPRDTLLFEEHIHGVGWRETLSKEVQSLSLLAVRLVLQERLALAGLTLDDQRTGGGDRCVPAAGASTALAESSCEYFMLWIEGAMKIENNTARNNLLGEMCLGLMNYMWAQPLFVQPRSLPAEQLTK